MTNPFINPNDPFNPSQEGKCRFCREEECLCRYYLNATSTDRIYTKVLLERKFLSFTDDLTPAELACFILAWHCSPDECIDSLNAVKERALARLRNENKMFNLTAEELKRMYFDDISRYGGEE